MATLKDIAQACGVSAATVSRALNGQSGKNTEYIRQVAKELGYFPNAAARTLKTNRSYDIGILYEDRMNHEYFSGVLEALRTQTERMGYDLTLIRRLFDSGAGSYRELARYRNLDGVVVLQANFYSADVMRLAAGEIPTVVIDHAYEGCDCVMGDNKAGTETLVREAWKMGHRRIALIQGEDSTVTRERTAGFYKACAELGVQAPAEYVRAGHFHDPEDCFRQTVRLLELSPSPTCVLCPDDYSCLGMMDALRERGVEAPRDVSLAGYDGIGMTQLVRPRLATYWQDTGAVARETAELLEEAIERPQEHRARQVVVSGRFLSGETLGPAPRK